MPNLEALRPLLPIFLTYILSFVFLCTYWKNYHYLLHVTDKVNGKVLWSNLRLLCWLLLLPFLTNCSLWCKAAYVGDRIHDLTNHDCF